LKNMREMRPLKLKRDPFGFLQKFEEGQVCLGKGSWEGETKKRIRARGTEKARLKHL